jgi:tryptophanyl-tRNA synthetase
MAILVAAGLDPAACTLFVQSQVPQHARLAWLMECTASFGELSRMTQFKEKGERAEFTSAGLFTYPALMAADILLYDTDKVPVGDDQRQHLELARDVATRFNHRYGDTFVVPEAAIPPVGARIMDLQEPTRKMSKSVDSPQGTILVLDPPKTIEKKIKRAVTDNDGEVRYDPEGKPGVANLLSILGAVTGEAPVDLARRYEQYGPLKADVAEAVVEAVRPLQERFAELQADPAQIDAIARQGAEKAEAMAAPVLERAMANIGLLPSR